MRKRKKKRLPHFESAKQEASFWSEHSTTEFEEAWEKTEPPVLHPELVGRLRARRGEVMKTFTVRLPSEIVVRIKRLAARWGQPHTWVVRRWILQGLRREVSKVEK